MNINSYIIDTNTNPYDNINDFIIGSGDRDPLKVGFHTTINGSILEPPHIGLRGKKTKNKSAIKEILTETTADCQCADNKSEICVPFNIQKLYKVFANKESSNISEAIKDVKEITGCENEACILKNASFSKLLSSKGHNSHILLNTYFKTFGPRNNTDLLSNVNIDRTLELWSREFTDFYPCKFSMIDFYDVPNNFTHINMADLVSGKETYIDSITNETRKNFKTFTCVLNTDISSGNGIHWVCVFIDCRSNPYTIEYFNSCANSPHENVTTWMVTQKQFLTKYNKSINEDKKVVMVNVVDTLHQKSNTECGMYVLYYIRCRLEGIPYTTFIDYKIPDEVVTKFREHIFILYD